mmetsp:Transcript_28419/g.78041  ORF Transcript_28419/g.78041 Transcript_28419/m.78041 type:complete len:215 (-) Transcript_28419:532-1176(-)
MSNAFIGTVVGVGEKCLPARLESVTVNDKAMVLWSDVAFSCLVVHHRLVLSSVSKRKLLGLTPSGKSHQLVSKADTKDWLDLVVREVDNLFQLLDSHVAHGGISRPVAEEESVEFVQLGGKRMVPWDHSEFDATLDKLSNDVELHSPINCKDFGGVSFSIHLNLLCAHFVDQMASIGRNHLLEIRTWCVKVDFNATKKRSLFTDFLGQESSVKT